MSAFYDITEALSTVARNNPDVNKVTYGDEWQVDLNKQTMFGLAHFSVLSATITGEIITFSVQISYFDAVDINKDNVKDLPEDVYVSNDNRFDVWATALDVLNDIYLQALKGSLFDDNITTSEGFNVEFFQDAQNNMLFGASGVLTIEAENSHGIC